MKGFLASIAALLLSSVLAAPPRSATTEPFLTQVNSSTWIIGNEIWNMTQGINFGVELYYKDHDCVGEAVGHYASYNGVTNLNWTSASIIKNGTYKGLKYIDVSFTANEGDMHWVIFSGLAGAYQYFVNHALPELGEFRTLWRLDNTTFLKGKTNLRDELLPPLSEYLPQNKVQDETWLKPDGSGYITKYDFTAFVRTQTYYGVYGPGYGSWYINAGKDYYNGDQLKQELMVHRESSTGDTVQLNMIHGTHFMVSSDDVFPDGKLWGPWLWYLNDGSKSDAASQAQKEFAAWPYKWFEDDAYQTRGAVKGKLVLSDGRPAANAAIFLGDNYPNKTALDMGPTYYYTSYADGQGNFEISNVRVGTYAFQAWSNGSKIADVTTSVLHNDVVVSQGKTTDLRTLKWQISTKAKLFQVGDFDRYSYGFLHGGAPDQNGLVDSCPANLTYTVGTSTTKDWCFGQSKIGNWSIEFDIPKSAGGPSSTNATLIVSLAGYSTGVSSNIYANEVLIGNLTSGTPKLLNDPCLYRSATTAGEWRYFEFPFDASVLTANSTNKIIFAVTRNTTWHGFMWDSIILEW
ncbi:polysaccharide lyase family 4 protein [Xylariales sp. PMI_506]|nr:polysaccharide lyase family 4 protein [Xylariales sp. PMI_506]